MKKSLIFALWLVSFTAEAADYYFPNEDKTVPVDNLSLACDEDEKFQVSFGVLRPDLLYLGQTIQFSEVFQDAQRLLMSSAGGNFVSECTRETTGLDCKVVVLKMPQGLAPFPKTTPNRFSQVECIALPDNIMASLSQSLGLELSHSLCDPDGVLHVPAEELPKLDCLPFRAPLAQPSNEAAPLR